jgi:hypothetical protein
MVLVLSVAKSSSVAHASTHSSICVPTLPNVAGHCEASESGLQQNLPRHGCFGNDCRILDQLISIPIYHVQNPAEIEARCHVNTAAMRISECYDPSFCRSLLSTLAISFLWCFCLNLHHFFRCRLQAMKLITRSATRGSLITKAGGPGLV